MKKKEAKEPFLMLIKTDHKANSLILRLRKIMVKSKTVKNEK